MMALKVDRNIRSQVKEYLTKHQRVNSFMRVNNGFTFVIDAIFRDIKESEDFIEELEERFETSKKMVLYVVEELKREAFLSDPGTAGLMKVREMDKLRK